MNYQDDIPLAKRIRSIKTLTNKSFLRLGLLFFGLGISLTFLANKSFLRQTKFLDDSINSTESNQNKSLLGHLPYTEASKNELILFSPGIYVHKEIYENFKEMQFIDCIKSSISGTENVLSRFSLIALRRNRALTLNCSIGIFKTCSSPEINMISSLIEYSKSPLFSERRILIIG